MSIRRLDHKVIGWKSADCPPRTTRKCIEIAAAEKMYLNATFQDSKFEHNNVPSLDFTTPFINFNMASFYHPHNYIL